MSRGYVYVLSNPSMPGLVKIGRTTRNVEQRAAELWQTGVPTPFVVDHAVLTPDCEELEACMHKLFAGCRVHGSREFFKITKDDVESLPDELDCVLKSQIEEFVGEYLGDMTINNPDFIVPEEDTGLLAERSGYHSAEVSSAIAYLTPEELEPAMQRWKDVVARRRAYREQQ
ncbi:MAG: GIY-YIG nuclease family protein, partial [Lentilitoribacter sp.]